MTKIDFVRKYSRTPSRDVRLAADLDDVVHDIVEAVLHDLGVEAATQNIDEEGVSFASAYIRDRLG